MPSKVLLDSWTFENYIADEQSISEQAQGAIVRARSDNQLWVSVISYLDFRERALEEGLSKDVVKQLDDSIATLGVRFMDLDQRTVISIDRIPDDADYIDRLVAAAALSNNCTLITGNTDVCCPDLDFILATPPLITAH